MLAAALTIAGLRTYAHRPAAPEGFARAFFLSPGSGIHRVAADLETAGLLQHPRVFALIVRLKGLDRRIKAGEYRLSPRMSPLQILEILSAGRVVTHPIAIPEGYTRRQIADLFHEKGLADRETFLAVTADSEVIRAWGVNGDTLEGYLFPDTYQVARGLSGREVVDILVGHFQAVVAPLRDRMEAARLSLEEVITLASIVEKETGQPEERPLIASVFLNRLKKGMRLQSDPTVIYGLQDFDGNLTRKHLQTPTPYNTYVIRGLPPGPIANPGRAAILAVLEPAQTDFLYFVSKNDGNHYFSRSLAEHNRAVDQYQRNR